MNARASSALPAGRPLVFMAGALVCWVGIRLGFDAPMFDLPAPPPLFAATAAEAPPANTGGIPPAFEEGAPRRDAQVDFVDRRPLVAWRGNAPVIADFLTHRIAVDRPSPRPLPAGFAPAAQNYGRSGASHNLLWAAGMARIPVPAAIAERIDYSAMRPRKRAKAAVPIRDFSVDGWLFLRPGSTSGSGTGPSAAAYGRSQAGAIARYRLGAPSGLAPEAYARFGRALVRGGETDLAVGLSARPIAAVPVRAHAEARLTRQGGVTELRPSVFATAGIDRVDLPARFEARGYGQAGWVGGRFATPFADLQVVADREIGRASPGTLRAGFGTWGGAQRNAQRLDIGPSVTAQIGMGETPARLALDYRVRVAGDAEPGSGLALTLSRAF